MYFYDISILIKPLAGPSHASTILITLNTSFSTNVSLLYNNNYYSHNKN